MNTLFGEIAARVAAFDPETEVILAAIPAKDIMIAENRSQLYDSGIGSGGKLIEPPYAISTVTYWKPKKKQRADHVTLKDKGNFHASIDIKFNEKNLMA